jgi:hypothetical protein
MTKNYYHEIDPNFCCYILKIKDQDLFRIGSTNKLQFRIYNLSQALPFQFFIYRVFHFPTRQQARQFENMLHTIFKKANNHIKHSWYKSIII